MRSICPAAGVLKFPRFGRDIWDSIGRAVVPAQYAAENAATETPHECQSFQNALQSLKDFSFV